MKRKKIYKGMSPNEASALLNQAVLTVADLAMILLQMGDPRSIEAIERGLYHALSSDRCARRTQYVPWSVAAMLRFVVELRKIALGETYGARFLAHQPRLRFRRKPGVQYAVDAFPEMFNPSEPPRYRGMGADGGDRLFTGPAFAGPGSAGAGLRPEQKSEIPAENDDAAIKKYKSGWTEDGNGGSFPPAVQPGTAMTAQGNG
jgi:hypothetical protein